MALIPRGIAAQPVGECKTGDATLHNAWASVFMHFPDRLDENVDGYIAVNDCSQIGEYRNLYLGNRWFYVRIADCRNPTDKADKNWLVDVDYRIWYLVFDDVPLGPHHAVLCRDDKTNYHNIFLRFKTTFTFRR